MTTREHAVSLLQRIGRELDELDVFMFGNCQLREGARFTAWDGHRYEVFVRHPGGRDLVFAKRVES